MTSTKLSLVTKYYSNFLTFHPYLRSHLSKVLKHFPLLERSGNISPFLERSGNISPALEQSGNISWKTWASWSHKPSKLGPAVCAWASGLLSGNLLHVPSCGVEIRTSVTFSGQLLLRKLQSGLSAFGCITC